MQSPFRGPGARTAPAERRPERDMTSQPIANRPQYSNELLERTSFLFGTNAAYIEALYAQYLENPDAVDESWRAYFASLDQPDLSPAQVGRGPEWKRDPKPNFAN